MTEPQLPALPHRVVIAGGGVAGLEAMIALRQLAGDRVAVTLLAPTDEFHVRALSVGEPFARPAPRAYDLAAICSHFATEFRHDALHAVRREYRSLTAASGAEISYDSLLVAVGAQPSPVFPGVMTFRGMQDAEAMHGLLQDVESGCSSRIAFVVPPGTTWPLPLYELALMTAERGESLGLDLQLTIVTPEPAPLGVFGPEASRHVDEILARRGIVVRPDCFVESVEDGVVRAAPGSIQVRAQRIVAAPRLNGPRIAGLPSDAEGFLPVDDHCLVRGTSDVFAAGDGTTFAIKQGGIAAQQANVAARAIARRAGADVAAAPFRPVLRAQLFTGGRSTYLRQAVTGGLGDDASVAAEHALWWPPTKVAAPHLAPYLEALDQGTAPASAGPAPGRLHSQGDPAGGIEVLG
jgi:sulfide:quinone oxidoreductase